MANQVAFVGVSPIGDTDVAALPVKEIGPAVGYYTQVLGFSVVSRDGEKATLRRDDVEIGLAVNGGDPEAASCYFSVSDPAALREDLIGKGIDPSEMRTDTHGGNDYRVFFAKEPYGVCFCFGRRVDAD